MGDEPADELRRLALVARTLAGQMHGRRVALARSALVWWQGGTAEAYRQAVQQRVNALAELEVRLGVLARACDALAAEHALDAAVARVVAAGGLR